MDLLTLDMAQRIVARILAAAKQDGKRPVSVAVADDRGDLLAFARMDGTPVRSVTIAINKAYTAARTGRDTVVFRKKVEKEGTQVSWFGDPKFTGLTGGLALEVKGRVVGGIGVSGRSMEEDHDLGQIGRLQIG